MAQPQKSDAFEAGGMTHQGPPRKPKAGKKSKHVERFSGKRVCLWSELSCLGPTEPAQAYAAAGAFLCADCAGGAVVGTTSHPTGGGEACSATGGTVVGATSDPADLRIRIVLN